MISVISLKIKFSLLIFFSQIATTAATVYISPYLSTLGYSGFMIGLANSVLAASGIVGQFFIGYLCDKTGRIRTFTIAVFLFLLVGCASYLFSAPVWLVMALYVLMGFGFYTGTSLCDSWILEAGEAISNSFGIIHAAGSIGFALNGLVVGKLISLKGYGIVPGIVAGTIVILIAICLLLPEVKHKKEGSPLNFAQIKELFKIKAYVVMLCCFFFLFVMLMAEWFMMSLKAASVGTAADLGIFLMLVALAEMVMMLFYNIPARWLSHYSIVLICTFLLMIKLFLYSRVTTVPQLYLICILTIFTYSPIYIGTKYMIDAVTPAHLKTTGQLLANSIYWGLSGIASPLIFGSLIDIRGLDGAFALLSLCAVPAIVISIIFRSSFPHIKLGTQKSN